MENKNQHIDPVLIIAKQLSHEASVDELQWLEQWLDANEENRKQHEQFVKAWNEVGKVKYEYKINLDKEWEYQKEKAGLNDSKNFTIGKPKQSPMFIFTRIAAIFIIGLFAAAGIYYGVNLSKYEKVVAKSEITEKSLPDGSIVTLNKNTKLSYQKTEFNTNKRIVELKGEAYFDVKPEEHKPFIIDAGDIMIQVLGTSFYVNAQKKSDVIEVIVNSGKVGVYKKDRPDKITILLPGNKATYNKAEKSIKKLENKDINFLSWKTRKIKFRNDKLSKIISTLNKVYDSNIIIESEKAANCKIAKLSFEDQSLDEILTVLEAFLDIDIKREKKNIIIIGDGC